MKLLKYFLYLSLLFFIYSNDEEIIKIDIKEGIYHYYFKESENKTLEFNAIDNGYYLITFYMLGSIIEATGDIHEDVIIKDDGFETSAYAQKFKKGDYFKMIFPINTYYSYNYPIKIEKLKSNINLRLITGFNLAYFDSMYINDCSKTTYFLFKDPSGFLFPINDYVIAFKLKIHSGEYSASYKSLDYNPNNNETINSSLKPFNISEILILPSTFRINVIELKCKNPGIISINYFPNIPNDETHFSYYALEVNGVIQNRFNKSHTLSLYLKKPTTFFFELYNIYGGAKIDMSSADGTIYNYTDFYLSYTTINNYTNLDIPFKEIKTPLWIATVFHKLDEPNDIILDSENKNYTSNLKNQRFIIPFDIKNDKKNIRINCSDSRFLWSLEFSQKNLSFIPYPYSDKPKLSNKNSLFLPNPYLYQIKETNYSWFIVLLPFNNKTNPIFSYEYTDENKDVDDEPTDDPIEENIEEEDISEEIIENEITEEIIEEEIKEEEISEKEITEEEITEEEISEKEISEKEITEEEINEKEVTEEEITEKEISEDEISEEENKDNLPDNNDNKDKEKETKLLENPFFYTTLVLLIIVIFYIILLIYCYKRNRKNNESIEKLINKNESNEPMKLMNEVSD